MFARSLSRGFIVLGLVVGGLSAGSAVADQTVNVDLMDFSLAPNAITVRAGEKVKFNLVNKGVRPHDVAIGKGTNVTYEVVAGAGNVAGGTSGSGEFTFTDAGDYDMWCPVGNHRAQGMVGTFKVQVVSGAALPKTGDPLTVVGLGIAGIGALSLAAGTAIRRRTGA